MLPLSLAGPFQIFNFLNPFPNDKFETSKLKKFAGDEFNFDENGRKFSERLKNKVDEQFLLFSQCFQKACSADT